MGSDPKTAGISMVMIGESLKDAREKKSVTIDQVQKETRIHSTVLKALEEGRCDSMLTPTYVKSFLKKYAEYLRLDARQMLSEYAKLHPAPPAQAASLSLKSKTQAAPPADLSKYFPALKRIAVAVIAIALVIFVGGKAVKGLKRRLEARAVVPVKAQAKIIRPSSAPAKKKIVSQAPVSAVKVSAVPLKLLISVNQTVLVKVKTDGNLLFSRVLTRGSVESFTAKDRINIYVAKGEAIELFLNGKSLGAPGKGPVKDIEITRSGLKIK
jgi:cytoskeletal protein RodZ